MVNRILVWNIHAYLCMPVYIHTHIYIDTHTYTNIIHLHIHIFQILYFQNFWNNGISLWQHNSFPKQLYILMHVCLHTYIHACMHTHIFSEVWNYGHSRNSEIMYASKYMSLYQYVCACASICRLQ